MQGVVLYPSVCPWSEIDICRWRSRSSFCTGFPVVIAVARHAEGSHGEGSGLRSSWSWLFGRGESYLHISAGLPSQICLWLVTVTCHGHPFFLIYVKYRCQCQLHVPLSGNIGNSQTPNSWLMTLTQDLWCCHAGKRSPEQAAKESRRVSGVTWVALKQGGVFTGALPVPLGSFSYQLFGHRFVCSMDVMECMALMTNEGICPDEVTADMAPDFMQDCWFMAPDFMFSSSSVSLCLNLNLYYIKIL